MTSRQWPCCFRGVGSREHDPKKITDSVTTLVTECTIARLDVVEGDIETIRREDHVYILHGLPWMVEGDIETWPDHRGLEIDRGFNERDGSSTDDVCLARQLYA